MATNKRIRENQEKQKKRDVESSLLDSANR